ncbi:hypothetical protein F2Q69_00011858 [Brassica cretica]|uniref:Uncharacterized protein n=1 Tax=Brassica cretica TaxID=69181 RepID=A0A8S9R445_BRACR|nr:hypothetical protein F2Q69_00011858 [Brassica cretica]
MSPWPETLDKLANSVLVQGQDLVNHIGGVFRYFIVDVVDPESTPDVARCGRDLGLRVTHKIRWWQAASIRKKGFRTVFDLQSQGVCDSHKMVFLVSVNGVADELKGIDSCGAYEGKNKWVYRISRLQRIESKGFWFESMVIQVLQELQVSIDICWKFWRRSISRFVVTITRYLQEREDSRKLQQEGCTGGRVCDQQCWRLI